MSNNEEQHSIQEDYRKARNDELVIIAEESVCLDTELNDQVVEVEVIRVFGKDLIYPVNDNAKTLARIAGTKTLSTNDLANAVKLGLNVKEVTTNKIDTAVITPGYGGKSWV